MRKSHHQSHRRSNVEEPEKKALELEKAVAQAWLSRQSCSTSSNEFITRRRKFQGSCPSRFKLEDIRQEKTKMTKGSGSVVCWDWDNYCHGGLNGSNWNFNQSLWDPYEIVAVSKMLEEGLMLGNNRFTVSDVMDEDWKKFVFNGVCRQRRESKTSLRNLMRSTVHSKRFD